MIARIHAPHTPVVSVVDLYRPAALEPACRCQPRRTLPALRHGPAAAAPPGCPAARPAALRPATAASSAGNPDPQQQPALRTPAHARSRPGTAGAGAATGGYPAGAYLLQ